MPQVADQLCDLSDHEPHCGGGDNLQNVSQRQLCVAGQCRRGHGQARKPHSRGDGIAERCGNGLQSLPQQHDFMDHTKDESQQQHGQWLWLVQELSCDWDRLPWQHGEEIVEP